MVLAAVVDFEESGAADFHFDVRYLPGNARTLDLLLATARAYERRSGRKVALGRVMAWNVLTVRGDARWRRSPQRCRVYGDWYGDEEDHRDSR